MKVSYNFLIIFFLFITSCASLKQDKNLLSVDANKIIVANSAVGQFFFTVNSREKTESGYRFNISIGNKNFSQFEGLSISFKWGAAPIATGNKKDKKSNSAPTYDLKTENIKISKLAAGEWQDFNVTIPAKSEAEMKIINLTVSGVEKISLNKSE